MSLNRQSTRIARDANEARELLKPMYAPKHDKYAAEKYEAKAKANDKDHADSISR